MDLRRQLENLGLEFRGFLSGLGLDIPAIEQTLGVEIEVVGVGAAGLALLLALFGTVLVQRRRRRQRPALEANAQQLIDSSGTSDKEALRAGLNKTRSSFLSRLNALLGAGSGLDPEVVEELETLLITSDLGVKTTQRLISSLENSLSREERSDPRLIKKKLQEQMMALMGEKNVPWAWHQPTVVMVVGVNGVGKTTTIGKLAARYTREGKKVMLAAGDTFRAAAVEQLEVWGERTEAVVVKGEDGADPASVLYTAVERARSEGFDLLLCDTAGRLQTKVNLMNELTKVRRVIGKAMENAPHETLMVLDATTGQNAISQAKKFSEAVKIDSLALTKLDGTAKGGVVLAIADELSIPVRFVGLGEKADDLRDFDPTGFVSGLFDESSDYVDGSDTDT